MDGRVYRVESVCQWGSARKRRGRKKRRTRIRIKKDLHDPHRAKVSIYINPSQWLMSARIHLQSDFPDPRYPLNDLSPLHHSSLNELLRILSRAPSQDRDHSLYHLHRLMRLFLPSQTRTHYLHLYRCRILRRRCPPLHLIRGRNHLDLLNRRKPRKNTSVRYLRMCNLLRMG